MNGPFRPNLVPYSAKPLSDYDLNLVQSCHTRAKCNNTLAG
jgi:hypothetical protein